MNKFPSAALIFISISGMAQNRDPLKTEIIKTDIDNFLWITYEAAKPDFKTEVFENLYSKKERSAWKVF
jgi:hypothetical protein